MLITFSSRVHHDVVMFGDIGLAMLRGMGASERVPGALLAADVPRALASLRSTLARHGADPAATGAEAAHDDEDEEEAPISLARRALPLIEMLEAAAREDADIVWSASE